MTYQWTDIYTEDFQVPSNQLKEAPLPLGFIHSTNRVSQQQRLKQLTGKVNQTQNKDLDKLRIQKSWEFCYSPLKNLPMNAIMSYFSPNSLQLIPILMTFNLLLNPLKDIFNNLGKIDEFEGVKKEDVIWMKLCYIASCLCNIAIGVWKLNQMKLIPHTKSDWLSWEVAQRVLERT